MRHLPHRQSPRLAWISAVTCAGTIALLLTAVGVRPTNAQTSELEQLLAYDAQAPLNMRVLSTRTEAGVVVRDITFDSVTGGQPTQAYLVRPARATGSLAGALFVHWYEPSAPDSNRTQLAEQLRLPPGPAAP